MVGNQLQWGLVVVSASHALPVVVLLKQKVLKGADVYSTESCFQTHTHIGIYWSVCVDSVRLLLSICP